MALIWMTALTWLLLFGPKMLGSLLVMIRQEERQPFMLMMDEAGDLLTSTVGEILVGTRKYGLGLTLAHQSLRQLSSSDQIYGAVTGSCRTKICFQVGGDDARKSHLHQNRSLYIRNRCGLQSDEPLKDSETRNGYGTHR